MKLRDVDALKTWLRETVTLISDAEPDDLAKYIVALLRKDKPERELEDLCHRELQIFFKENTMEFLSQLFSTLRTESYLTDKVRKIKKESGTISPARQDVLANRAYPSRNDDDDIHTKSVSTRNDDRYNVDSARTKQSRGENRDLRSRLGDMNSREYKRHRDDYERRDRRKRTRSRSPFQRRRSGTSRHHQDDLRSLRLRRRSRERSRSRDRSESRSPFTQSGFRSEKYFFSTQKTPSDDKEDQTYFKKISTVHSRSSSTDFKDDKEYKITEPLDDVMICRNSIPMSGQVNKFRSNQDVPKESPVQVHIPSVPTNDPSVVVVTSPPKSQPTLVTVPPSLPIGFGVPPPTALSQFPAKLIPAAQPIQSVVSNHPPQIIQHFTAYPPPSNLVPSLPLGMNFQSPQIIIPKEPTSRHVVGFTSMNSFPAYIDQNSIKNRLGIKIDNHQARFDGNPENTLLINNIPPALNNISSINQQFSKFGTIRNIQVHYSGNPSSALITFGSHSAAESAYNSSEPVFNNRFIEVLWYHDHSKMSRVVLPEIRRSVKERLGGLASEPKVQAADDDDDGTKEEEQQQYEGAEQTAGSEELTSPAKPMEQKRTVVLMPSKNPSMPCAPQSFVYNTSSKIRKTSLVNKKGDLMKEVMKRKLELEKKKRLFFEEQLQKQKSIIEELQKPGLPEEERSTMKKKLKELSLQSRRLKAELDGSIELMKPENFEDSTFLPNVSAPELKKQILDAELDLISQAKEGVDTTELDKKIKMMKKQASIIFKRQTRRPFAHKFPSKPPKPFFKAQQGKAARLQSQFNPQMSSRLIDRRPKQLVVSGFQAEKKNAVIAHLGKFGKMEKFEDIGGKEESIIITYATRKEAEQVARMAADFEDKKLAFAWAKASTSGCMSLIETHQENEASLLKEVGEEDCGDDDDEDSDTMIELMIEDDGSADLVENSLIDGKSLLNLR